MTSATLALLSVALLAFATLLCLVLFLVKLTQDTKQGSGRPPWPMPGGPARPLWRERWDPRVPFPSDLIAEQWDQEEAKAVAARLRAQSLIAQDTEANWFRS